MASLTIVVDGAEQRFPLESAAVTLGRGLESDIRLKDIKASRRHCQIVRTAKGYQCVDLSSGNGTYVNGVQIKSQMLDSGDKITVGSTTIAFEESAPPPKAPPPKPASTKAPTAKIPVAQAPAPAPPRSATAKVPAAGVQAAPTRKSTVKVEAVKTASQGALKPATQPLAKSASRLGKPIAGTRGTRPRAPEPPKKKSRALLVAIVLAVVVLGGGGAWFATSRDGADQIGAQIDQLLKKAEAAEKEEKVAAAVADYRKALELCQGERYKYQASDITRRLSLLESKKAPESAVRPDPAPKEPAEKGPDVQAKKAEIADKYKLSGEAADWSGAVKEWSELARGKPSGDFKSKAEGEIRSIQDKARRDLDRLRKKAEALATENKMAEALDLLKQQKPRFEHTDLNAELDAAIRQYDK